MRILDELYEGADGLAAAIELLEDRGPDPEVRRGLEAHPRRADRAEVMQVLDVLGLHVHEGLVLQTHEGLVHARQPTFESMRIIIEIPRMRGPLVDADVLEALHAEVLIPLIGVSRVQSRGICRRVANRNFPMTSVRYSSLENQFP